MAPSSEGPGAGCTSGRDERPAAALRQRVTLPALMQEVHTFNLVGVLPTVTRTDWMLGFQRRLVRRWEWEMLLPNPGPLPHTSQVAATVISR